MIYHISDICARALFMFSDILLQCILSCERNKRICLCDDERRAVTFRIRLVVTPLRLFLDDDSSGGEEKDEEMCKCNKEKNFYTMNATSVVS